MASATAQADSTAGRVRVGIVGCGVIAPTHIESYQRLAGVEVAWACDPQRERADEKAAKFGIAGVTDSLEEVLADDSVDAVSICTPHADHAEHVEAAFAAGKHVLCEKPLGASVEQLDRMVAAHAAKPELRFGAVFQHRFDGAYQKLRELVAAGEFGTALIGSARLRCYRSPDYYADDWHGTWAREGGSALINQAIHFLDSLQWIMGGAASVTAHYANRDHAGTIETEDTLTASLAYQSGALGTFEVTSASNLNWTNELTVHGTRGAVEIRDGRVSFVKFQQDEQTARIKAMLDSANDPEGAESGKSYYGTGHTAQIADFVEAMRVGREPFVTGESAQHTVRIVLGAYESHRTGRRVELPQPVAATA